MQKSNYRPEIDGLRALAVSAVVLFHMGFALPGGFIGVDVFFVISGFLITGIIRRGLEKETFSLVEFWERRVRRIFPAIIVVVLAALAAGYWLLLPSELEELGESSVAQAVLLANVYFWRDTGYFEGPAELKPLLHTWSLAVEEQFYLFFPFLLMCCKRLSRKRLFWLLATIAVVSLGGSIYGTKYHPNPTFYLLPTRAWELLAGCMLAVLPCKYESAPLRDCALGIVGFMAILLPVFLYDSQTPFPGLAAIPPVIGTVLVIFATSATRGTPVGRLLSLRPVVFVGLISYSLYLWHWPVIVFVRTYFGRFDWQQAALAFLLAISLSMLSWRYIETPCRGPTFLKRRRRLFGTAFLMSGITVAVSLLFIETKGLPRRYPPLLLEDVQWLGLEFRISITEDFDFETLPVLGLKRKSGNEQERPDFLLWGDSHGMVLATMLDDLAAEYGLSGKAAFDLTHLPLPGICRSGSLIGPEMELRFQEEFLEYIRTRRPRNLILISRWSWHTDGYTDIFLKSQPTRSNTEYLHKNQLDAIATPEGNLQVLVQGLKNLTTFCEERGVTLWVVKQVPEARRLIPAKDFLLWSVGRRNQLPDSRSTLDRHRARQANSEKLFGSVSATDIRLLDPAPYFFDDEGILTVFQDGRSYYSDENHLTRYGVEKLRPLFNEMFLEIKKNKER